MSALQIGLWESEARERMHAFYRCVPTVFERITANGAVLQLCRRAMPDGAVVTLYSDITPHKKAEAEMERARTLLSPGETQAGGRDNPAVLADAFEAVVAALYRDGGMEAARACLTARFEPLVSEVAVPPCSTR